MKNGPNIAEIKKIFNALPDYHVIIYSPDAGVIEWANKSLCDHLKLTPGKIRKKKCSNIDLSLGIACLECPVRKSLKTGREEKLECSTKDGRYLMIKAFPVYDPDRNASLMVEMIKDISRENENEERYRQLAETSTDMIFIMDQNGIVTYANPAAAAVFRINTQEMIGMSQKELFPPQLADRHIKRIKEVFTTGTAYSGDNLIRFPGRDMYQDIRLLPLRNKNNQITSVMGIARDITDRKNTEQELKRERNLFVGGPVIAYKWKALPDWPIEYISPNILRFGYTAKDFLSGKINFLDIIHPNDRKRVVKEVKNQVNKEQFSFEQEYRIICADKSIVWVNDYKIIVKNNNNEVTHFDGYITDITQQKEALEQLTQANNRVIDILKSISDAFFALDDNLNIYYFNREAERLLPQPTKGVLGRNFFDIFPETRNTEFVSKYRQVILEKSPIHFEFKFVTNNEENWYDVRMYPQKKGITIYFQMTTEKKKAEEALKYRYRLQQTLFLIAASFIKAKVFEIDNYIEEALQSLGEFVQAARCSLFILSEDSSTITNTHEWCEEPCDSEYNLLQNVPSNTFAYYWRLLKKREFLIIRKLDDIPAMASRERRWIARYGFRPLILIPLVLQGFLYGMLGLYGHKGEEREWPDDLVTMLNFTGSILINALERKKAEEALAAEKERLLITLGSIGDGVITTDVSGKVILMNRVAEELTGWSIEEAIGRPLFEVLSILEMGSRLPYENPMEELMKREGIPGITRQNILNAKDGRELIITDIFSSIHDRDGNTIGKVIVFRDITEKIKLEESMQSSQKLESIGVLAGGIAHDFNNLLGGIYGYIELAQRQLKTNHSAYEHLKKAMGVFRRAKNLTQQLLTFSKGGKPVKKVQILRPLLEENVQFVLSGSKTTAAFSIADDLWPCNIDENQISQVIDNIVINARQAMPDGGKVTITAGNITSGSHQPSILGNSKYVQIKIMDEGPGISREHILRIFDPFFTTKQHGSGLGLATAYSIVKKHDGLIEVDSEPGKGAVFTIYLPASPEAVISETGNHTKIHKGHGRILVMDDEEFVRDVIKKILGKLGYTVDCATDGEEAIKKYNTGMSNQKPFDLVILDLTIPGGMGGQEVMKKLLDMDPAVTAVASSGYSDDPVMADPNQFGFKGRLVKPYLLEDIVEVLKSSLPVNGETHEI
ncbi:MAG: PAS domain S-box protein [Spirochaetales bacterium]|nr:PAS domain S-box protein [Spirochaetales bacterium]